MTAYTPVSELIKLYPQLYVGFKLEQHNEEVPREDLTAPRTYTTRQTILGFAAPYENNKACAKRRSTIDYWAHSFNPFASGAQPHKGGLLQHVRGDDGNYTTQITPLPDDFKTSKIIDNVPLSGFRISDDIRRVYWGGGNVVWRVYDPRGFELEISSANLMKIIDAVGIQSEGVIPARCVWGRLGSNNILIPEGSDQWDKMMADQKLLDANKQLKIMSTGFKAGDLTSTKLGPMIYLGQLYAVCRVEIKQPGGSWRQPARYQTQVLGPYYALFNPTAAYCPITLYKSNPILSVIEAGKYTDQQVLESRKRRATFAGNVDHDILALVEGDARDAKHVLCDVDRTLLTIDRYGRIIYKGGQFYAHSSETRALVLKVCDDTIDRHLRVDVKNWEKFRGLQTNSRYTVQFPSDLTQVEWRIIGQRHSLQTLDDVPHQHLGSHEQYYNGLLLPGADTHAHDRERIVAAIEQWLQTQPIYKLCIETSNGTIVDVE